MMRRRRLVLGLSTLGAAALLAAVLARMLLPGIQPESLVLAVSRSALGPPFWIAERKGYFAAEGLDLELVIHPTGKAAFAAMLAGEADVATVAETPLVFASLAGTRFQIIASFTSNTEYSLITRAAPGLDEVSDLRGRRIGVDLGTAAHYFLHVMLSDAGLSTSDIEWVPIPGREQAEALRAARVDAIAAFAPYSTQCRLALGEEALSFPAGIRYRGYGTLVTRPGFSTDRAEAVRRLLRATDHALDWMRAHPEQALLLAAEAAELDVELLRETWDAMRPNLGLDHGLVALLETEARWAIAERLVPGATSDTALPDYLDLIDPSVLAALHPESVTIIGKPTRP